MMTWSNRPRKTSNTQNLMKPRLSECEQNKTTSLREMLTDLGQITQNNFSPGSKFGIIPRLVFFLQNVDLFVCSHTKNLRVANYTQNHLYAILFGKEIEQIKVLRCFLLSNSF